MFRLTGTERAEAHTCKFFTPKYKFQFVLDFDISPTQRWSQLGSDVLWCSSWPERHTFLIWKSLSYYWVVLEQTNVREGFLSSYCFLQTVQVLIKLLLFLLRPLVIGNTVLNFHREYRLCQQINTESRRESYFSAATKSGSSSILEQQTTFSKSKATACPFHCI